MTRLTKAGIGIILSQLEDFKHHIIELEQYSTPPEIAAEMLWHARMKGDIEGKVIADPACGPGFLGLGALLLGAEKAIFIDIDEKALDIARRNYETLAEKENIGEAVFVHDSVECLKKMKCRSARSSDIVKIETVLQNPPFGTKRKHADKVFLESIFSLPQLKAVYTIHKTTSARFIEAISKDYSFNITDYKEFDFVLKATMKHHKKKRYVVKVGMWRLEKVPG